MKKRVVYALVMVVLYSCFVGCQTGDGTLPELTPTSVIPSKTESFADTMGQSVSKNGDEQSVSQQALNEDISKPSQETALTIGDAHSQSSQGSITGDECIATQQLELQSIDDLEAFFRGDRPASNQVEADIQKAQANQGGLYYRPALLNRLEIHNITPYKDSIWYFCNLNPKQTKPIDYDIGMYCGSPDVDDNTFEFIKNHEDGKTAIVNGIEYAYKVGIDGYYGVSWKQFGCTCIGTFWFTVDQIEDYLPLLRFEQASYQSNSDHVTQ